MQNLESVEQVIEISFFNRALHSIDYHQSIIMSVWFYSYANMQGVVPKRQIYTLKFPKAFILMESQSIVMVNVFLNL